MTTKSEPEVLIVEDEPMTRMNAANVISDVGITIREAGDAAEALEVLQQHPKVGLVFTDIDLPGEMDGLVLTRKVHEDRPDVELIVTSGATCVRDKDLPDHGTFLPKPYRAERLLNIVREKLEHR